MFAQTTHVFAAPRGFACVVIPAARLYIPSFIEIRSGVSEPRGGQNLAFPITLASRFYNSLYYRTSRETLLACLLYRQTVTPYTILLYHRHYYTVNHKNIKTCHFIFHYNSRTSWWIFTIRVPKTGMNVHVQYTVSNVEEVRKFTREIREL